MQILVNKNDAPVILADMFDHEKVDVPRRVGFDYIKVGSILRKIDFELLCKELTRNDELIEKGRRRKVLTARECRSEEKMLQACKNADEKYRFSSIRVNLPNFDSLVIRKCNLSDRSDICVFEIHVPITEKDNKNFGNINNMLCEDEKVYVRNRMKEVEKYGLYLDLDIANIREVEINVNASILGKHNDLRDMAEMLEPAKMFLGNFIGSEYSGNGCSRRRKPLICSDFISNKKNSVKIDIAPPKKTSFNTISSSIICKVYDKSADIQNELKNHIDTTSQLTRIEFVIKDSKEVYVYFNQKTNLFEMNQDDVENAFHKLSDKFIRKPLNKYYDKWNLALEKYFENVDINKPGWKKTVVMELDKVVKQEFESLIIPRSELSRYVSYIKADSIKKNRARIVNDLEEEFRLYAACIRIAKTDICKEITDWLCSIEGEEEQYFTYNEDKIYWT